MVELSFTTLNIVALTKIILFIFVFLLIFLLYKKDNKPWHYLLLITSALFLFYLVFCYPLKKMLWGNTGDESYIFAFLRQVMAGNFFKDFYNSWLPVCYPPLYFWVTGFIASFFTSNGIVAAKIGVLGSIVVLFFGFYFLQYIYFTYVNKVFIDQEEYKNNNISKLNWFWMLLPIIYFILLDFDIFIFKPFEVIAALGIVIFAGLAVISFETKFWNWKYFLFFILSGGIIFLTYYLWWFIAIPTLLILIYLSSNKFKNFKRLFLVGLGILAISFVYLLPLLITFFKNGIESWQATFITPSDLSLYVPWFKVSFFKSVIYLIGLYGLIKFSNVKFIKASLINFIVCFLFYLLNIILFIFNYKPMAIAKSFLFLGNASLAIGAAYFIVYYFYQAVRRWGQIDKKIIIFLILIFIPLLPFVNFVDDPVIRRQIEIDLQNNKNAYLSEIIAKIPQYDKIIWLSGALEDLPAFLPLSYYLAYNIHFSNYAANYSQRMNYVKQLATLTNAEDFYQLIKKKSQPLITGLIFYKNNFDSDNYYLYFWEDNYPNGGKDLVIKINKNSISETYWQKEYEDKRIIVFTLK